MIWRLRTRLRGDISPRTALICLWLLLAAPPASAADYEFVDAGALFGRKGHFGRCHAWGDLDGDGLYDIITGSHDRGLMAFRQVSPLNFERVDSSNGLRSSDPLYGILILDFDRDGDNDVFLNRVGFSVDEIPSSTGFMRNRGGGIFRDVTISAGVSSFGHGFALVALDYDKDGWIDVYAVNHDSPNILFRNDTHGAFVDMTETAGVGGVNGRRGRSTSATSLDFDRDGWMDIFVSQRDNPDETHPAGNNLLYHNQGDGTFVDVTEAAGLRGYGNDFVASAGDIDGDNWTDLYVATFNFGPNGFPETEIPNRLYINNQDGTFSDASQISHTNYAFGTMGLAVEDHDSDGLLDIYVGTGGPFELQVEEQIFYWNHGDLSFTNSVVAKGLFDDARGHGSSMFDYDRDGDLDLFASLGGHTEGSERLDILYLNSGGPAHWLEVQLVGEDCPLEGLGARVVAIVEGREIWRWVRSNAGFDSFEVPHVWFGLGEAASIERLEVTWPCGRVQTVDAPGIDQHIELSETGADVAITAPEPDPLTSSRLGLRADRTPFRGSVLLTSSLETNEPARVAVYDLRGRLVRSKRLKGSSGGEVPWSWNGRDTRGELVAAGRYVIELRQAERRTTVSVVLVR
jgi:hypothetical protein